MKPTDTRIRKSRKALRSALVELMLRERFEQITVRDIAKHADVGYTTFFRHYSSKAQLLDEIAVDEIGKLLKITGPHQRSDDTLQSCIALCAFVHGRRELWTAFLKSGATDTLREEFIRQVTHSRYRAVKRVSWLPIGLGATYGVGATLEIISWWLARPDGLTPEQVAYILNRLVVEPTVGRPIAEQGATLPRNTRRNVRKERSVPVRLEPVRRLRRAD